MLVMPRNLYLKLAKYLFFFGLALIITSYLPAVYYSARSQGGKLISRYLVETAETSVAPSSSEDEAGYQPAYDADLPFESRLVISSIGVDTEIYEASVENFEEALKKGVWRTPNFGTPVKRTQPTILAAHRFGYLKWSNQYRHENSFYNLPKLDLGDTAKIIWRQRTYTYAVYNTEEGTKITDYGADLILYTCRDLTSDIRIFVYLRLLEI